MEFIPAIKHVNEVIYLHVLERRRLNDLFQLKAANFK